MNCPTCQRGNRADARFCDTCGAALAARCASCERELRPDAVFCDGCGQRVSGTPEEPAPSRAARAPKDYTPKHLADKILRSKSALEGERKQVSVLFADVRGSMELAAELDPEAWHRILERFFEILTEGVHRFEGTVNQYTGDGIMALFGAPIAHEDHAQRACFAALRLRNALRDYADELRIDPGVNFSFRLGLNSGEVVVGKIGDDLRMDYTAQGHTVGLAQRMEQLAPADGIALSAATQRHVDGYVEARALGPARVKGVADPVQVYVLEGVGRHRTRLDSARARGLSRFVGRSRELETLQTALDQSLEGTGRVAAAVGEAGVGKSRLCFEFLERCRARGLPVYEAHCPAHGRSTPYLPLLELLRNLFGIDEQDGQREARQKIAGELALLDDGFSEDRALVLDFLGVADPGAPPLELDAEVRRRRLFGFLRRLIQLRAESEPIVLLVDDLHWIDPASDLFLAQIVEAVGTTRAFLLVNFRPEYEAEWTRKSWVLQLPMAPLGPDALAELVRDWVGTGASVASLPQLVGARSGGNPFFAEEIVLSLIDTGSLVGERGAFQLTGSVDALQVPPTVGALLAARIDRLGENEKQLLYAAAVIGKEVPRALLAAVSELPDAELDPALDALLAAELVYERALYPVQEIAFKHPLTHEVALGAQLGEPRRARHAAVAREIEALSAERLDEQAGLLAHHYTQAGEDLLAAGWHVRAARWVRASDLRASQRHWSQARERLVDLPDSPERTTLLLEVYPQILDTLDRLGAESSASDGIYEEARDLARHAGDRAAEALVEAAYGWLKTGQNEWKGAVEHGRRAMQMADEDSLVPIQIFSRFLLGRALTWRAPQGEMIRLADEAAAIGGGDDAADIDVLGWRPYVLGLSVRAAVLAIVGRPAEALEWVDHLPAILRRPGMIADTSYAMADRIWVCWILGDADRARVYAAETLQTVERWGTDRNRVYALFVSGVASMLGLRWDEGLRFFEQLHLAIDESGASQEWGMFALAPESLCWGAVGELDRGLGLAQRCLDEMSAAGTMLPHTIAGVLRARLLRAYGGSEHMEALAAQVSASLDEIERVRAPGYLPQLLLERAGLCRLRDDADGAARDLAEARRLLREMGATGWDDYARSIESAPA